MMLALLLVAVSLGLSNFAAAIAIGITGVDRRLRLRIALAFGVFEAGMPIAGCCSAIRCRTRSERRLTSSAESF